MSGKPYPEGVAKAVSLMDEAARLQAEIKELTPKADRLNQAWEELSSNQRDLTKLLESMDLTREGNSGYADRLAWFLQEMRRRVADDPAKWHLCRHDTLKRHCQECTPPPPRDGKEG